MRTRLAASRVSPIVARIGRRGTRQLGVRGGASGRSGGAAHRNACVARGLVASLMLASGCATYSFKLKAPFETTDEGFWYRADCRGPCDLHSAAAEATRLSTLDEMVKRERVCPAGYVIEKREPLAVTRTAIPDIVVYEGRCTK